MTAPAPMQTCQLNPVVNGDFKSDSYPGSPVAPWENLAYDQTCNVGETNLGVNGSTRAAELSCDNTADSYAQISQVLTTCPGVTYDLSFFYKIVYGQAYGSYVLITVNDTTSNTNLVTEQLENYCDPSIIPPVDGYGNPEGDWYEANSTVAKGFGQITALSNMTTVYILLRSGYTNQGSQTLIIDFDNVVLKANVPTGATIERAPGYPTVTGTITGTQQPSSVPSKQGVSLIAVATPSATGLLPWLNG